MRSIESTGQEQTLLSAVIDVCALRPQFDAEAAEWRSRLPSLLMGIVGEVPGAELEFELFADTDGMVQTQLIVSGADSVVEVANELSATLAPVAETVVQAGVSDAATEWPLIPDNSGATSPSPIFAAHFSISSTRRKQESSDHGSSSASL